MEDKHYEIAECPRCGWESSYSPPITYPSCPICDYPHEDARSEE